MELTSGLGRDRGESGGLRGVLVAPTRHREKLGQLSMGFVGSVGFVGSGYVCSDRDRVNYNGLGGAELVDIKGTGGPTGHNREALRRLLFVRSAAALNRPEPTRIRVFCWEACATSTARGRTLRQTNQNNGARGCACGMQDTPLRAWASDERSAVSAEGYCELIVLRGPGLFSEWLL